jgi:hypothetical protein
MLSMRKRDVLGVALVSVPLSFVSFCQILFSEIAFVNVDKSLHNFKQTERYFSMWHSNKRRNVTGNEARISFVILRTSLISTAIDGIKLY